MCLSLLKNLQNLSVLTLIKNSGLHSVCTPPPPPPLRETIVTLLDVNNVVGQNLALILKQNPFIQELRLYDEHKEDKSLEKNLNQIDTRTLAISYEPKDLKDAITGAHLVLSFGGYPDKPELTTSELFEKNVDSVRNAAIYMAEFNPQAVFCVAKPPVEALIPMVSEEYKRTETYNWRKILGVSPRTSMAANSLIARLLNVNPINVLCPIIGGFAPDTTVAIVSQTKPPVPYNSKLYTQLQQKIANTDSEILKYCGKFPDCNYEGLSQAVALARIVNVVNRALIGEKNCVDCAFVRQMGHIGDFISYMASIVVLGREGITSTHMPKINDLEILHLRTAIPHLSESIALGETYITGDFTSYYSVKHKRRTCDCIVKNKIEQQQCRLERKTVNN